MSDLLPPNSTELERHLAKARSKEIDLEERLNVLINIDSVIASEDKILDIC